MDAQNVVIQVAKMSDFSDAVTVFNNDAEDLWGFGAGTDSEAVSTAAGRTIVLAEPVEARYVRYYQRNVTYNSGEKIFNSLELAELEVYAQVPVDLTEYTVTFQPENGEKRNLRRRSAPEPQPNSLRRLKKRAITSWAGTLDGESYDFNTPVTQDITLVQNGSTRTRTWSPTARRSRPGIMPGD